MTEDRHDADDRRIDGGTATGADETALDPWGSSTITDYENLFEQFGIEEFERLLPAIPDPHYLMRRGVIFGHRNYDRVAEALREGEPAAALSGFMPTGDPHVGHKLVFDELIWHQRRGADTYGLIADLEAHSARGLSWEEIDAHARDYLLSLLALGFDAEEGELYRQSTNRELQDLAFELGIEANFSELAAIYGFDGETDVSHMQSVVTQMADILYPQLEEPKPTVIPVGPDQDPHVRLARDLASRMRYFKVTDGYASLELTDAERAVVSWLYESLKEIELTGFEEEEDGVCTCKQASILLNHFSHQRKNRAGKTLYPNKLNSLELSDAGRRESSEEWEAALELITPLDSGSLLSASQSTIGELINKLDSIGQQPLRKRTRAISTAGVPEAFEVLVDRISDKAGEVSVGTDDSVKERRAHIDTFVLSQEEVEELARAVEIDHGGYGFIAPSSIYHRFMTGLTGGKMSSSVPASHISLLDDPEVGYNKVNAATTGGRETAALQRELGGEADECPVYELYAYLLAADDDEYTKRVYDECTGGERLCGDCKEEAANLMRDFLADHQEKREEAKELLADLDIELDSTR